MNMNTHVAEVESWIVLPYRSHPTYKWKTTIKIIALLYILFGLQHLRLNTSFYNLWTSVTGPVHMMWHKCLHCANVGVHLSFTHRVTSCCEPAIIVSACWFSITSEERYCTYRTYGVPHVFLTSTASDLTTAYTELIEYHMIVSPIGSDLTTACTEMPNNISTDSDLSTACIELK